MFVLLLAGCGDKPADPPIAFYGDSLTAHWKLEKFFPGKDYLNFGTSGRTATMLSDAFDSTLRQVNTGTVVILAGTNDVLFGVDDANLVFFVLTAMYDKAKADGMRFVVCTLPPMRGVHAVFNPVITNLNNQLRSYAQRNAIPLADYYSVLVDPATGALQDRYAAVTNGQLDTVHVNDAGYTVMTPLAAKAIGSIKSAP